MIFDPLLPVLDSRRYLFLALDGDLTRLPFEVLPMGEELYLLDHYHVRYLSSGRDLLRFKEPASPSSPPLVIADPDYNLEDHSSGAQGRQVYRQQSRDLQHSGGEGRFPRLPKTQEEGMQIGKILNVQPRLNKEALKGYLKRYNSPYILHIASHGFFLPNQPVQAATRAFDIWDMVGLENIAGPTRQVRSGRFEQLAGQQIENPLLRAGLALAGANTWERRGALPPLAEDGILNAEEVCGLNMQGTELVVLSACETGLGDVDQRFGEGVFGLRRAFMLAGAKTLVMSLWHVPDEQTQQLMNNFYRFMLGPARLGRAEALRSAQLELKSHYPHPYYWGGFICQGDPGPLQLRTEE